MIQPLDAVILGVVEGLTEFLPVSSTGHLILASKALNLEGEAIKTFEVVIQGGALVAVLGLYRGHVKSMFEGIQGRNPEGLALLRNLIISFIPAAVIGLLTHRAIKEHLFGVMPVIIALALGGLIMNAIDRWVSKRPQVVEGSVLSITANQALIIGLAQCLALWPGTSRSMVTILAALLCGLSKKVSAEYSFLLALPTLGAATVFDFAANSQGFFQEISVLTFCLGMLAAAVVAALAIKGFVQFISKFGFFVFGWYRVALAGVVWFFVYGKQA